MRFHWVRPLLSLLFLIALVFGFGFLGFKVAVLLSQAAPDDFLSGWRSLGTPPGRAVSIQTTSWQSEKTIVKSANGKYYYYQPLAIKSWVETSLPYTERTALNPICQSFYKPPTPLPHSIIDCRGGHSWEYQRTEYFVAVLDDGSVWRWRYGVGMMESLFFVAFVTLFGAVIGFLISKPVRKFILHKVNIKGK